MSVYIQVARYNFLKHAAYPWEVLASVTRKLISLGFLLLFWQIVAKGSDGVFDLRQTLSYFLIAQGVVSITNNRNRFSKNIAKLIKSGEISNYFIKPMSIIPYLYASYSGSWLIDRVYSVLSIIVGILVFPPAGLANYLLFLIFFILALLTGLFVDVILGSLSFFTPESSSFRHTFIHIYDVFSGALIPLVYFPPLIKRFVDWSPFPYMVFAPTNALQNGYVYGETLFTLLMSLLWLTVIWGFAAFLWKKGVKGYQGVGI